MLHIFVSYFFFFFLWLLVHNSISWNESWSNTAHRTISMKNISQWSCKSEEKHNAKSIKQNADKSVSDKYLSHQIHNDFLIGFCHSHHLRAIYGLFQRRGTFLCVRRWFIRSLFLSFIHPFIHSVSLSFAKFLLIPYIALIESLVFFLLCIEEIRKINNLLMEYVTKYNNKFHHQ